MMRSVLVGLAGIAVAANFVASPCVGAQTSAPDGWVSLSGAPGVQDLRYPPGDSGRTVGAKSPWLAWGLSFVIPGAGQAYNGQWLKGTAFAAGTVGGAWLMVLGALKSTGDCVLYVRDFFPTGASCEHRRSGDVIALTGATLMFGSWVWSQIDAPRSAKSINARRRAGTSIHVRTAPTDLQVGIRVPMRLQ